MQIEYDKDARTLFVKFEHMTPQIRHAIATANKDSLVLLNFEKDRQILDIRKKTGVEYRRLGRFKRRSAAGETPSEDTGAYRNSFEFKDEGGHGFVWGTNSPYGGYLEDGTSKMDARHGVENVFLAVEPKLLHIYENHINKVIQ